MLDRLYKLFTSLRLTVILLILGFVLVLWGTLAQVKLGLYQVQAEFFRSFFIYWSPAGTGWKVPIFPGGYLLGGLLLINLVAAHFRYYQPGGRKMGIVLIHLGVVMLLVGQVLTDVLSVESRLHLRNGQTKNYTEGQGDYELALVDKSDPATDLVVAIPASRLKTGATIQPPEIPLTLRLLAYFENSSLAQEPGSGHVQVGTTAGFGRELWWRSLPRVTAWDRVDVPSGIVEVVTPQGSLGTFLVSVYLDDPQEFVHQGRRYELQLRPARYYKPFSIQLLEFRHDKYPGTEIPKNFSSRVRLVHPTAGEDREVLIYMNNPLRYHGETYYQSSFDPDDQGTVLQVVRNPSWLTPYLACLIVGLGMAIQFGQHLWRFAGRRKAT